MKRIQMILIITLEDTVYLLVVAIRLYVRLVIFGITSYLDWS